MRRETALFGMVCVLAICCRAGGSSEQALMRLAADVGQNGNDRATAMVADHEGNVYVTGYSQGAGSGYDYLTLKYASDGKQLWARRYDGPGNEADKATAIGLDALGNVYVTGSSQGEGTGRDYATIKYSPDGEQLWVQRYNGEGNGYDYPTALAVDPDGNSYVTGYSQGAGSGHDYLTVKYSPEGKQLWAQRYNGAGNGDDRATSIGLDNRGGIYVTGSAHISAHNIDYLTLKYASDGKRLWVQDYNGRGNGADNATALVVDRDGGVIVTGSSFGGKSGDDYLTVKYSSDGKQLWEQRYDGPDSESDKAIAIGLDGKGNVYVTGDSYGSLATGHDYLTLKYSPSGKQLWAQRYNGEDNSNDRPIAMVVDTVGNVYVTGDSYGGLEAGHDFLTVKYAPDGKQLWIQRYNGPGNDYDVPTAIAIDGKGDLYVTGSSWGGHITRFDFTTIKYDGAGKQLWVQRYDATAGSH